MCGRFVQKTTSYSELKKALGLTASEEDDGRVVKAASEARYNVAPTQDILNVRRSGEGREAALLRWGLVPAWAKDPGVGARLINARAETVESKPSFRAAFKRRRCLIPAAGFYEWAKAQAGRKQPYYFQMKDEEVFAFAGLWERWEAPTAGSGGGQRPFETCTIITTEANSLLAKVHDRMPVILSPEDYDLWLGDEGDDGVDPREQKERLGLLRPYPAKLMKSHAVGTLVNSPARQGAELITKAPPVNSK